MALRQRSPFLSVSLPPSLSVSAVSVSLCVFFISHRSKEDVSRIIQSFEDLKRTER